MKHIFTISLTLIALQTAFSQSKIDLAGRMLIDEYKRIEAGDTHAIIDPRLQELSLSRGSAAPVIGVIVTLNPEYTAEDILINDAISYTSTFDNTVVAQIPADMIETVANLEAVNHLSMGQKRNVAMSFARPLGEVTKVQQGTDLQQPYNGTGVVVGLMDTGLDPNHINFTKPDNVEVSRVKAVYAYASNTGRPTSSATTAEAIKSFTTDMNTSTHGTHVIGIAAGGYKGNGNYGLSGKVYNETAMPFYGVATESDIVMTGGNLYDANIIDGVTKCIEYAESVGKPVTVNLSLGSMMGPHDGSSDICNKLAALGKRGIICIATGNDGGNNIAMSMRGGLGASLNNNVVGVSYGTSSSNPYTVQFWSNNSDEFKMDFILYDPTTKTVSYSLEIPNLNGSTMGIGGSSMGSSYIKDDKFNAAFTANSYSIFSSQVEANDRYSVIAQFKLNRDNNSDYSLMPAFRISRSRGQVVTGNISTPDNNTLGQFTKETGSGWTDMTWTYTTVNDNGTVSDMATGENIIAVGAFTSAQYFTLSDGSLYSYNGATPVGSICEFSSYGTNTVTGEVLPHVCAPGSAIVSSLSNYYIGNIDLAGTTGGNGRSNKYGPMQGTSMATPFVTGVMGLWLQADPTLTVSEAKDIIKQTATPYTGSDSNLKVQWGAGKINAYEGIKEVLLRKAATGTVVADQMQWLVLPATDGYDVVAPGAESIEASLYDVQGRCVTTAAARGCELRLTTAFLPAGIYILRASSSSSSHTSKLLIQ
ncbi:MAG: S8 family serine peptidase [Paramuribaculum sp.]|nr:S8 family serine peptidase [Paramuribaculum sp.]